MSDGVCTRDIEQENPIDTHHNAIISIRTFFIHKV
tara:strand:+ start:10411 stop:10515 length:105 start_codon:yes stop_codon:yes gene_type:complete